MLLLSLSLVSCSVLLCRSTMFLNPSLLFCENVCDCCWLMVCVCVWLSLSFHFTREERFFFCSVLRDLHCSVPALAFCGPAAAAAATFPSVTVSELLLDQRQDCVLVRKWMCGFSGGREREGNNNSLSCFAKERRNYFLRYSRILRMMFARYDVQDYEVGKVQGKAE